MNIIRHRYIQNRVCGGICKNTYRHSIGKYMTELGPAFDLRVDQDVADTHPSTFCNNGYIRLMKHIKNGMSSKSDVFCGSLMMTTTTALSANTFGNRNQGGDQRPHSPASSVTLIYITRFFIGIRT
jgi:hypothetical protein